MASVIICIRARNEERWLRLLLRRLFEQTFTDFEVVLVNNKSSDLTLEIAASVGATIVNVDEFNPSFAINKGIMSARSFSNAEFAVILSAHCIPVHNTWLECLVDSFQQDKDIVGVYGRQIPMRSSNTDNMRDLLFSFGDTSFIHSQKLFFHNANSAIRLSYFCENLFDESISHIEDFAWALKARQNGKSIFYCASAVVWHQHGIHQHSEISFRSRTVSQTLLEITGFEFPEENVFDFPWLRAVFVHEFNSTLATADAAFENSQTVAKGLNMEFFMVEPDKTKSLFQRIREAIPWPVQIEADLVFFWSDKYGHVDKHLIKARHQTLISDCADAVVPMSVLNQGLCVATGDHFAKFTSASALSDSEFYTTSFGRGSMFWGDAIRRSDLGNLNLSKVAIQE